ncbi:SKP1-like protein 1A [Abeliophyllum distichum]|uniref:SKP1-like protein 1A n=1 Tax=Abeliophyllum distichum TaxID=126358 RepID=A0ABD1P7W8_9LAMI
MQQRMIVLKSSDGETFEVEKSVVVQSKTIQDLIENNGAGSCIHLPNVTSDILVKVIEYCKRHVVTGVMNCAKGTPATTDKVASEDLKAFDADFVKVDQKTLFDINTAANDLKIKNLLDLTSQTKAIKRVEELFEIYKIRREELLTNLALVRKYETYKTRRDELSTNLALMRKYKSYKIKRDEFLTNLALVRKYETFKIRREVLLTNLALVRKYETFKIKRDLDEK